MTPLRFILTSSERREVGESIRHGFCVVDHAGIVELFVERGGNVLPQVFERFARADDGTYTFETKKLNGQVHVSRDLEVEPFLRVLAVSMPALAYALAELVRLASPVARARVVRCAGGLAVQVVTDGDEHNAALVLSTQLRQEP